MEWSYGGVALYPESNFPTNGRKLGARFTSQPIFVKFIRFTVYNTVMICSEQVTQEAADNGTRGKLDPTILVQVVVQVMYMK